MQVDSGAFGLSQIPSMPSAAPLDYGLDGQMFVHDGRPDLPDLDLEVPSACEPTVAALVQQAAAAPWAAGMRKITATYRG